MPGDMGGDGGRHLPDRGQAAFHGILATDSPWRRAGIRGTRRQLNRSIASSGCRSAAFLELFAAAARTRLIASDARLDVRRHRIGLRERSRGRRARCWIDGRFRVLRHECCPVPEHLDRILDMRGLFLQSLQDTFFTESQLAVEVIGADHEFVNQPESVGPLDIVVRFLRGQIIK